MEDAAEISTTAATFSQLDRGGCGGGGGGGKLRRERKPPATPYDRPFRGRWISKLVDPAKRIFSGLPSLFSSNIVDEVHTQTEHDDGITEKNWSPVVPDSTRGFASSEDKGKLKLVNSDEDGRDKRQGYSSGGVPDIEQLIKRKTFSREEIDRLMKILHTRVVDVEQDRNTPIMTGNEVERADTSNIIFKTSLDDEEDLHKLQLTSSTSPRSAREDGIGASPVDIAKAYMSCRASEMGFTPTRSVQESEKMGLASDYISNSVMSSPLRKAPISWPGAITHDQQDYAMPPSWNNRSCLRSFSRTPYSRTVYSKSKSRLNPLRGDNEKFPSISPAPFQPTGTPAYEKARFMNNVAESSYGTGGRIRRTHNRLTLGTPTRDSPLFSTARRSPLVRESSPVPLPKKTFELGNTSNTNIDFTSSKSESPEARVQIVHPHSNRLAWKILEQLDRPVTLKEQSKELSLGVSQQDVSVPNNSSPSMARVGVGKHYNLDDVYPCGQTNRESNGLPQEGSNKNGAKIDIFGSIIFMHKPSSVSEVDNARSSKQGIYNNAPKTSLHFGEPSRGAETINNNTSRSESRNSQRKPILPSIAVEKSSFTTSFSSITSSSFTFPVSTSSTSFTEPSTPSIIPSILTISPPQPKGFVPTSNSRNKITIAPPVVSFSSITTFKQNNASASKLKFESEKPRLSFAVPGDDTSTPNDAAIPKFRFGSGESRLSFDTVVSDTLCC